MGRDWYPMPRTTERRCPLVWCLDDWNFRYAAGTLIKVINHPGYWDACRCKLAYLRVHLVVTEPWSHDKIVLMQKISNHPSSSHLESSTARVGKNSMDTLFDVAVVSGLKMQNTGLRAVLGRLMTGWVLAQALERTFVCETRIKWGATWENVPSDLCDQRRLIRVFIVRK